MTMLFANKLSVLGSSKTIEEIISIYWPWLSFGQQQQQQQQQRFMK